MLRFGSETTWVGMLAKRFLRYMRMFFLSGHSEGRCDGRVFCERSFAWILSQLEEKI
jgi:hypothetical protein